MAVLSQYRRRAERLAAELASVTVEGHVVEAIDLSFGGLSFRSREVSPTPGSMVSGHIVARTAHGAVTAHFAGESVWSDPDRHAFGVRFAPMNGRNLDGLMSILSFLTAERDRLLYLKKHRVWLAGKLRGLAVVAGLAMAFAASAWASYSWLDLIVLLKS